MGDVRKLIGKLAEEEAQLLKTRFLAPCVPGGSIRTRISNLVYTFSAEPRKFEGWGLFKPLDVQRAKLVEEAGLPQIDRYLKLFKTFRLRLVFKMHGLTWLAYPVNESDARQRLGKVQPLPVRLISDGGRFEQVITRCDGASFWFEETDRREDPLVAEQLRQALSEEILPENLRFKGLTPEMRSAYQLAFQGSAAYRARLLQKGDEDRLREALALSGAQLQGYRDREDFWLVEWSTADGERHSSAISKESLTVISAGICLEDRDADFDLQSLVGVIEQQPGWME
jgi:hypothetical protein